MWGAVSLRFETEPLSSFFSSVPSLNEWFISPSSKLNCGETGACSVENSNVSRRTFLSNGDFLTLNISESDSETLSKIWPIDTMAV